MIEPRYGTARLEGVTLIGFVGQRAAAEVLCRVLRHAHRGKVAAEAFLAPCGEGVERTPGGRGAPLKHLAGARAPGLPVLGGVWWNEGGREPRHRAVLGLEHLAIASVAPGASGAFELARRLRDRWVPPLHLAVSRVLGALPVALIASTAREPGRLVATSSDAPLSLAASEEGVLISSDAVVARAFSRRVVLAKPGELAVADADGFDLLCARTLARMPRASAVGAEAVATSRPRAAGRRLGGLGAPAGEAA